MIKRLLTQPLFLIGFLVIVGLVLSSFLYTAIYHNEIPQDRYLYDDNGRIVDSSPLSPSKEIWFGTDRDGFHMLHKVIIGAKFTILAALGIAFLRVLVAIPIGMILSSYLTKSRKYINGFVDSFHYIPLSLIAYYILYPVLWMGPAGYQHTLTERVVIEVVVLTVLTLPILSVLIGNEGSFIMKKDYIISAQTLGASRWHIIRKHILPSMKEKFMIMFGQQVVQVLLIFSHLGLLKLFFGGTVVSYDPLFRDPPSSSTLEWSGLIGDAQQHLYTAIWIPFTPILFFAITIFAVNLMIEGFTKVSTGETRSKKKKEKVNHSKNQETDTTDETIHKKSFELEKQQSIAG
ncbi:ABC transporter permease [Bacillus salitolerans]|uniref:ABC transporter permease n=1 Tax=Bacillus salitolerans TaxID=1437434 RepID=A0ABW4LK47_9BACI